VKMSRRSTLAFSSLPRHGKISINYNNRVGSKD
jgi:hypothetical protein